MIKRAQFRFKSDGRVVRVRERPTHPISPNAPFACSPACDVQTFQRFSVTNVEPAVGEGGEGSRCAGEDFGRGELAVGLRGDFGEDECAVVFEREELVVGVD